MSPKADAYGIVTDRLIEAMEQGTVPWDKPWRNREGVGPTSLSTGKAYRGINVWILSIESMLKGYTSQYWATFKQAKEQAVKTARAEGREIVEKTSGARSWYVEVIDGEEAAFMGGVRKGEKGTQVVLWKPVKKEDKKTGETSRFLILKHFTVFNLDQCDGVEEPERIEVDADYTDGPIESAQAIVDAWIAKPRITHGGNSAHYSPAFDYVAMPEMGQFDSSESYYAVLFHELAHSTGHESRLKRKSLIQPAPFGSEDYSQEELVAEFAAAFLTGEAGIEVPVERSASYLANWLQVLKNDRKMLVTAAAQAQKAADFVLGIEWGKEVAAD
jgi:antirestriction protein ArdC